MFRNHLLPLLAWLRRAVNQPRDELDRWQRAARFTYDLGRVGARQLRRDRAPQMASALAFRSLFGLAPVLVVATILIKVLRGPDAILSSVRAALVAAGLDQMRVGAAEATETSGAAVSLAQWLEDLTAQLLTANMSAVGWVGMAVIAYAAIGLMVTVENSFNVVYRAPDGRPWTRRVPLYWFILTISPLAMGLASFVNSRFTSWIDSVTSWQWLLVALHWVWGYGLAWLFMTAVYVLVPNSKVTLRPALTGACVATLLLGVGKNTLGAYLGTAFAINQLYGSLGLVPLFMFWVYLMWLAVLFGLEVSAILQNLHGRSLEELQPAKPPSGLFGPTSVLAVMELLAEQFLAGQPVTVRRVAEDLALPETLVTLIVARLVEEGWLHHIERPEPALSLARPPERMDATELLRLGFELIDENSPGRTSVLMSQLREAQQQAATGMNLAMLIPAK